MAYLALAEGESHRNQYLHVDLCGPEPNDEPGNSRGSFPELAPGVVAEHSYTPFDAVSNVSLPPMLALGGGRAGDVVQKAQFYIRQVEETGEIHLYRGYTRVYADAGLNDLQMDWKSVFNVIPTHIRGDVICTIDRPGSAYFECPDAKDYDGNFVLNTVLIPDMKATIQNWGFRVDWNTVATIDTRLSKPEMMIWAGYSVNLRECTALNVLQYNGNCSLLVEAESLGWIEFYLGCNMPIAGEAREEMLKLDSKTLLTQITGNFKKYYATIQPYYAVFACPTATCPCGIADLVALKGKPIGAMLITEAKNSKKKMRIEEEGDEEEEE